MRLYMEEGVDLWYVRMRLVGGKF